MVVDPRVEEMELLQAMYSAEGEFKADECDAFSFTIRLLINETPLSLAISLPESYADVPLVFRIVCDRISPDCIEQLTHGLQEICQSHAGEPCVTLTTDYLMEHARELLADDIKHEVQDCETSSKEPVHGDLVDVGSEHRDHYVSKDGEIGVGSKPELKVPTSSMPDPSACEGRFPCLRVGSAHKDHVEIGVGSEPELRVTRSSLPDPIAWIENILQNPMTLRRQAADQFNAFDANHDRRLDKDECLNLVRNICEQVGLATPPSPEKVEAAFHACDKNHDERLDSAEFEKMFQSILRSLLPAVKDAQHKLAAEFEREREASAQHQTKVENELWKKFRARYTAVWYKVMFEDSYPEGETGYAAPAGVLCLTTDKVEAKACKARTCPQDSAFQKCWIVECHIGPGKGAGDVLDHIRYKLALHRRAGN